MFDEDSISGIWGSCDDCNGGRGCMWVVRLQKSWLKKLNQRFQLFRPQFDLFWMQFLSHNSPPPSIAIVEPSNSQYYEFECTVIVMGVKWVTKIADEINRKYRQCVEKNVLRLEVWRMGPQTQSTKKYPCFLYAKSFQTTKSAGFSLMFTNI